MRQRSPVIAFLVASPFELLDFAGPAAVFAYPIVNGKPFYSFQILSTTSSDPVKSMGGIAISGICKYSEYTGPIDTLVVVGGLGSIEHQPTEILDWLRRRSSRIRRVASVCTGAFVLAASGLLDGRRVATHWRYCDLFVSRFKHLKVEREPIFIQDGKFYTTAGVSAGIDLALALVEEDLGHSVAAALAREFVLFLRRPGNQTQYSTVLAQQEELSDKRMRDLPVWTRNHLDRKLDVRALANVVAMSPRTFARQFQSQFGTTPARWIQSLRVEAARQHLESHDMPLKRIARVTGFRDEQALRRAFIQQMSLTPKQYRERFGVAETATGPSYFHETPAPPLGAAAEVSMHMAER
jgi:transcriptional regulator GlxA family with amidase domain